MFENDEIRAVKSMAFKSNDLGDDLHSLLAGLEKLGKSEPILAAIEALKAVEPVIKNASSEVYREWTRLERTG
ncbi:MAG: hypothetical protein GY772_09330 [bacterium]|nr:hypothetical protein [bacterium]MCP4447146.1 hypothetical protein [Myxococcales bacterium]